MTDPLDRIMRICNDGEDAKLTRIAEIVCGEAPCHTRDHWIGEAQRYLRHGQEAVSRGLDASDEIDRLRANLTMAEVERDSAQKRMNDANASARAMFAALKLAEEELAIVEREIRGLAPEAKSKALPMIRALLCPGCIPCEGFHEPSCAFQEVVATSEAPREHEPNCGCPVCDDSNRGNR